MLRTVLCALLCAQWLVGGINAQLLATDADALTALCGALTTKPVCLGVMGLRGLQTVIMRHLLVHHNGVD